jgi:hypothetical protein
MLSLCCSMAYVGDRGPELDVRDRDTRKGYEWLIERRAAIGTGAKRTE